MYVGHVDYGDKVLYKFELTHEMKKSRQLLIDGKLKEYPDTHKKLIADYVDEKGFKNASRIKDIMNSNAKLISAAPDMDSETSSTQISQLIIKSGDFL